MRIINFCVSLMFVSLVAGCQAYHLSPRTDLSPELHAKAIYDDLKKSDLIPAESSGNEIAAFPAFSTLLNYVYKLEASKGGKDQEEALGAISTELQNTGYFSKVYFQTKQPGAYVQYQLVTSDQVSVAPRETNTSDPLIMPLGIYYVWAERKGVVTSKKSQRDIIRREIRIDIEEVIPDSREDNNAKQPSQ